MSDENTAATIEHVTNTVTQLKEMRHYSKTNVEQLTAMWLLFEGELSKLKKTEVFDDLMNRQGQLHDALEAAIENMEKELEALMPAPEAE